MNYLGMFGDTTYFNELTANQLGATTVFNPNTPLDYIDSSIRTLNSYFQQIPKPGSDAAKQAAECPEGYETTELNLGKFGKRTVKRCKGRGMATIENDSIPPEIPLPPANNPMDTLPKSDEFNPFNFGLSSLLKSDEAIGFGLIVLAIILAIIAVLSFR